jgi:hypothetical protein
VVAVTVAVAVTDVIAVVVVAAADRDAAVVDHDLPGEPLQAKPARRCAPVTRSRRRRHSVVTVRSRATGP